MPAATCGPTAGTSWAGSCCTAGLEDEKPFNTVRRLVQQEDYALQKLYLVGLPSPRPYGVVELTPEREYLLVTEFFAGATELGEAEVDDQVIDDGLSIIRKLWEAGLAHRDIKPANLLVRQGRLLLIDVAFVEVRPSPWRQAVDLANMMLCLGLRSSPERVYQRALRQFSVEEISEGFAAARGLALPSQLRRMLREQGRDVHGQFLQLLPQRPRPIRIQRWSARRIGLLLLVVPLAALLVPTVRVVLFNHEPNTTRLADHQPGLCRSGAAVAAGPVGAVSLTGALRANSCQAGGCSAPTPATAGQNSRSTMTKPATVRMVVRLTPTCDPAGATETPSQRPGVRHYEQTERRTDRFTATWYDQFPGGCVTSRLDSTSDLDGTFATQAPRVLGFVTRQALQQALAQRSNGRLHLDPAAAE